MSEDSQWQKYSSRFRIVPSLLNEGVLVEGMIVCIPVYAEPTLLNTLESLVECEIPDERVEVMILFNQNNLITEAQLQVHECAWKECLEWVEKQKGSTIKFTPLKMSGFPDAKGGVGWARKVVMDEAARKLSSNGIIVCLDADCLVAQNYLTAISDYFKIHSECQAVSIYYEHVLDGLEDNVRQSIVQYELHLRYLVHAMRWVGHPFAFQTVGSAMAVRRNAYLAQGGMNTRQAGEDFYFLQKFIELHSLDEINETVVYPSSRVSSRVPFGTGRAMQKLLGESIDWNTTDFEIFRLIKPLLENVDLIRNLFREGTMSEPYSDLQRLVVLQEQVMMFLRSIDFMKQCKLIYDHTNSPPSFRHRFFRFFNAFMMIRFTHYMRDHGFVDVPIGVAVQQLANEMKLPMSKEAVPEQLLNVIRKFDRNQVPD